MHDRFRRLLSPWTVTSVDRDDLARRVVVRLTRAEGHALSCPECRRERAGYDSHTRMWRSLDADGAETILEASLPRCSCPEHGVNSIDVPWGEAGGRFSGFVEWSDSGSRRDASRPVDGERDSVTRREFLNSTVVAASSLLAGGLALSEGKARGDAAASRAEPDWGALRGRIKGEVVPASAPEFQAARSGLVWNQIKPDRSPDVIVRVKREQDVVEAVNFARENGLKIVAKGGGHTCCGLAVRQGA